MRSRLLATLVAAPTAALLAIGLGACSGSDGTPAPGPTVATPTAPVIRPGLPGEPAQTLTGTEIAPGTTPALDPDDASFVQDMIVHHAQALVMVDLASPNLTDTQVKALASRIRAEQQPEIDGFARWLTEHKQSVPPQAQNPAFEDPHGSHVGMPGMATDAQLAELKAARGADADRLFLRLMTAHHQGAIQMVRTLRERGSDERVGEFGDEIHIVQSVQIQKMQEMLSRLSA